MLEPHRSYAKSYCLFSVSHHTWAHIFTIRHCLCVFVWKMTHIFLAPGTISRCYNSRAKWRKWNYLLANIFAVSYYTCLMHATITPCTVQYVLARCKGDYVLRVLFRAVFIVCVYTTFTRSRWDSAQANTRFLSLTAYEPQNSSPRAKQSCAVQPHHPRLDCLVDGRHEYSSYSYHIK